MTSIHFDRGLMHSIHFDKGINALSTFMTYNNTVRQVPPYDMNDKSHTYL